MLKLIHVNKEHENIAELLPWYVNGTLSDTEHDTVEKHVSVCKTCQQDIKLLQHTLQAANDFDAAVIPSDENFNRIMQRIERTDDRHASSRSAARSWTNWYRKPQLAIAASFLGAMLVIYLTVPNFLTDTDDRFRVLTTPDSTLIELEVLFEQNTDLKQAQSILREADSRFEFNTDHPVYTITLPSDYDVLKISELVKQLNSKTQVVDVRIVRDN